MNDKSFNSKNNIHISSGPKSLGSEPVLPNTGSFYIKKKADLKLHKKRARISKIRKSFLIILTVSAITVSLFLLYGYYNKDDSSLQQFSNDKISIKIPKDDGYIFKDSSTSDYGLYSWTKNVNNSLSSITVRVNKTDKNIADATKYIDDLLDENYFKQSYVYSGFEIKDFEIINSSKNNQNFRDVKFNINKNYSLVSHFREIYIISNYKIAMIYFNIDNSNVDLYKLVDEIGDSLRLL